VRRKLSFCDDSAGIEPAWFLVFSFLPDFFQSVVKLNKEMVSVFVLYGKAGEVMAFKYACYFHGFNV
jgi:hypothetical protein